MFREETVSEDTASTGPGWYALRVRSNYERVAAAHLRHRGLEVFAPTFRTERQWSDRRKRVDQFLFTGYVFCRMDPHRRQLVVTVPGAVRLVGFGDGPVEIPPEEIQAVQRLTSSGLVVAPWPFLRVGQRVLVERGPLAGVEGILQEIRKSFRLVVSVGLLQRSVSAEVDRSWIRPLGDDRAGDRTVQERPTRLSLPGSVPAVPFS